MAMLLFGVAAGCSTGIDVGTVRIAPYDVHVSRGGDFKPGSSARFNVVLGAGTRVDDVQLWFGEMSDTIHFVAEFDNDGSYEAKVPIANPMPPGSMLWMSITASTSTVMGAIAVH
jgi:hypothetical protein